VGTRSSEYITKVLLVIVARQRLSYGIRWTSDL
jgi:hypothetical protein